MNEKSFKDLVNDIGDLLTEVEDLRSTRDRLLRQNDILREMTKTLCMHQCNECFEKIRFSVSQADAIKNET